MHITVFSDSCLPIIDIGVKLFKFLECHNFYQQIDERTRFTSSGDSILDLIISDSPGFFTSSTILSSAANYDHDVVCAVLDIDRLHVTSRRPCWWTGTMRYFSSGSYLPFLCKLCEHISFCFVR